MNYKVFLMDSTVEGIFSGFILIKKLLAAPILMMSGSILVMQRFKVKIFHYTNNMLI